MFKLFYTSKRVKKLIFLRLNKTKNKTKSTENKANFFN